MVDTKTGALVPANSLAPVSSQDKIRLKEARRIENMRRSVIILRNGAKNNNNTDDDDDSNR